MNNYYVNIQIEIKNRYILYGENLEELENEMKEELETAIKDAINNKLELKRELYDAKTKVKVSIVNEDEYKGYRGKNDRVMIVEKVRNHEKRN